MRGVVTSIGDFPEFSTLQCNLLQSFYAKMSSQKNEEDKEAT